jgi:hypothetical protein
MDRREALAYLGSSAAGLAALAGGVAYADGKPQEHLHAEHFAKCAKACADCMNSCSSCFQHCAGLATTGKQDHVKTMNLCNDCSEFCSAAAKLSARGGPLAGLLCEACAKACDQCGADCAKFPDDKHMADCAKACKDCAVACREMVKHLQA